MEDFPHGTHCANWRQTISNTKQASQLSLNYMAFDGAAPSPGWLVYTKVAPSSILDLKRLSPLPLKGYVKYWWQGAEKSQKRIRVEKTDSRGETTHQQKLCYVTAPEVSAPKH